MTAIQHGRSLRPRQPSRRIRGSRRSGAAYTPRVRTIAGAAGLLLGAVVLFGFRHPIELRLLRHESVPAPLVSKEPVQEADGKGPFEFRAGRRRYRVVPRFRWDESGRVLSERPYRLATAAVLIPHDLVLGWGPVVLPPYAGRIHFTQYARFYMWGTSDRSLDRQTIATHTANTHVIPSDDRLRRALACVARGDDVRLEGWLVDVEGIDEPSFRWATSTSREDEGPGGCETVFLKRLTIGRRVYE